MAIDIRSGLYWVQVNWRLALLIAALLGFIIVNAPFGSEPESVYKVVLDAGSTGTRAHVFRFNSAKLSFRSEADLDLLAIPLSVKIKGGLSDFASDPKKARPGLEDLIQQAKTVVPRDQWAATEVILMATAGLRLINPAQADALLAEARSVLGDSGFRVGTVDVIDGKLEAKLMYTMAHFVTRRNKDQRRMAIVDLGGGSVQLAYSAGGDFADLNPVVAAEVASYLENSKKSTLYLHSWLGYGLVAFRLKALEMVAAGQPHPCVPEWTPKGTEYAYGDKKAGVVPRRPSTGSPVEACLDLVRSALSADETGQCKSITLAMPARSTQCGLNGSWLGPSEPNSIAEWRLFSYIFDLAAEEGLVKPGAADALLTANDFKKAAKAHCEASRNKHADKIEWWKCVDLVYVSALLTDGFKLESDFPLRVTKHLSYKGEIELEAAWPLGAAVAAIQNDL